MRWIIYPLISFSFVANAQRIKGIDFDQKWKCVVKKVYSMPASYYLDNKKNLFKSGDFLLIDKRLNPRAVGFLPSINDLIGDVGLTVGGYQIWHYAEFERGGPQFERFCQGPCLIYTTRKVGRWVFLPMKNGRMVLFYDIARYPDLNMGERSLEFHCIKAGSN